MEKNKEMIVEGYALVFNEPTLLWEYEGEKIYEAIDPRALDGCDLSDVCFRYNHSDQVFNVARVINGTLKLTVDNIGLKIRATLANTTVGRDLYEMIRTKLLNKMSFAFVVGEDSYNRNTKTRTIKKLKKIIEVSAVDFPAYPQTSLYVLDTEVERLRAEIMEGREALEIEKLRLQIKNKCY
ncbi:HK97 family phage prohead protease [Tissierella carlieri]|uniref:HK97 family phage prohead protease n=1 Tax=Tissierella carlieri TaxID=689904 RepID=UPI001C1223DD|nr:HK97 family phage prohead protease [Tissierella carlieri]MBU5312310.1 HK97 family phage prohead protease [Tissierella carlieri]